MTLAEVQSALGSRGLSHPPEDWLPITLSDSADLSYVARAILNRGSSSVTLAVYTVGSPSTSRAVVIGAGQYLPGLFTRVLVTGSDASPTISGAV
jgi:hypothetical protein